MPPVCTHWRAAAANFALQNALVSVVVLVFVIVNKGQTVARNIKTNLWAWPECNTSRGRANSDRKRKVLN